MLGGPNSTTKSHSLTFERVKLPSLTPVMLPNNKIRMGTPWLSTTESPSEMDEKMMVAQRKNDLANMYKQYHRRANTWHNFTLSTHSKESLDRFGRPKTKASKVKVEQGMTASFNRVPVDYEAPLDIYNIDQRRDYASFVLKQRQNDISERYKNEVRKMYLPYMESGCVA